ncbi:hypothetical protein [Gracilimonas mengyeensis]|uniref:Uncharacterized protein n=1 Tax=Gracilimonas mengyeensis TaxID=1302730 RepID=A0A521DHT9_9BACT|nr:hypothetical protein [Gracilimonas mengyeensis]SMO71206.1 hypothetical protein SAMN06265219_108180 [Gracilimonas mengyeensis]
MRLAVCLCVGLMMFVACENQQSYDRTHYFLRGYDDLEFRDSLGTTVPPSDFIRAVLINGVSTYEIADTSLVLWNHRAGEPYTGYIRTFHKYLFNIEARFQSGKIQRMRFWYGDRTLGMDADYEKDTGALWNQQGQIAVSWNARERYYLDAASQVIRRIISDTLTSYFDASGELTRYTVRTDTALIQYYANGNPRFQFPISRNELRSGEVKRWHPMDSYK